jgi:putative SOS response-associated peptidase YedK
MCGRTTRNYTWEQIRRQYQAFVDSTQIPNLQPRYNICPTTQIDTIVASDKGRLFQPMRWGLVPSWWKKTLREASKLATFNVRSETITEKPMFRNAWRQRQRCIVLSSGYYEWQHYEWQHIYGQKKPQPWYFTRKDGEIISIAGLWDRWVDMESGKEIRSCTMAITEPNAFVAKVHDRMPVILEMDQVDGWLAGELGTEVLKPAPHGVLQMVPVSQRVNSSRAPDDDPTLIEPVW